MNIFFLVATAIKLSRMVFRDFLYLSENGKITVSAISSYTLNNSYTTFHSTGCYFQASSNNELLQRYHLHEL